MKRLYIDFDGVILDTIEVTYKMLQELGITEQDEKTEFFANLDWEKLLDTTDEINCSIECIQKIIDSEKFEVSILTHVNSLQEIIAKVNYIRRYFPDITIIPVPKFLSKTKMIHTEGSILIDDYAGNLREWKDKKGIAVLFSKELEDKGFKVINKLDQILTMDLSE